MAGAVNRQTLSVLEHAKKEHPYIVTKSSIMLGLGETEEEVLQTMRGERALLTRQTIRLRAERAMSRREQRRCSPFNREGL